MSEIKVVTLHRPDERKVKDKRWAAERKEKEEGLQVTGKQGLTGRGRMQEENPATPFEDNTLKTCSVKAITGGIQMRFVCTHTHTVPNFVIRTSCNEVAASQLDEACRIHGS